MILLLIHKCCTLFSDEDGDFVQFSSNEELDHAVDCMCDDTLRVFVTVSKKGMQDGSFVLSQSVSFRTLSLSLSLFLVRLLLLPSQCHFACSHWFPHLSWVLTQEISFLFGLLILIYFSYFCVGAVCPLSCFSFLFYVQCCVITSSSVFLKFSNISPRFSNTCFLSIPCPCFFPFFPSSY